MLDRTTCPLNVALIRRDLTTAPPLAEGLAAPRTTRAFGYATFPLRSTERPLTLVYRLNDL